MSTIARAAGALSPLLALVAFACGDLVAPDRDAVAEVTLAPAEPSVEEEAQVQLEATVKDGNGNVLPDRQIFWTSQDETIARVSATGLVTAVAPGKTQIAASAEGKHGFAAIQVLPKAVASVQVTPDTARVAVRGTVQLQATPRDAGGRSLSGRQVTWSSSNTQIATVDGSGVVRGVRPGVANITARSEGKSGVSRVRVLSGAAARLEVVRDVDQKFAPVGATLDPITVRVTDSDRNPVQGVRVVWQVTKGDGSVAPAQVDTDASGHATTRWTMGRRPGEQRATASVSGVGSVEFTVVANPGSVGSIVVEPESATLTALDETVQFTATALDEFGNPVTATFGWASSSATVAIPEANGRVRARGNGSALIIASAGDRADTATVRVEQAVTRLTVSPASGTLNAIGYQIQLGAVARDRNGHAVPTANISWSSLDDGIATVNASGAVIARAPGTARIRATAGSVTDQATVLVRQVPASVALAPSSATLNMNESRQFLAVAADSNGVEIANVQISWSSVESSIAEVDNSGVVTGKRPGTTAIRAAVSGVGSDAEVRVTGGFAANLTVVSGDRQTGTVRSTLPQPLVVRVTTASGEGVGGVTVRWSASHGTLSPAQIATDPTGHAATSWTLGSPPNQQRATASVEEIGSVTFTAQGRHASSDRILSGPRLAVLESSGAVAAAAAPAGPVIASGGDTAMRADPTAGLN